MVEQAGSRLWPAGIIRQLFSILKAGATPTGSGACQVFPAHTTEWKEKVDGSQGPTLQKRGWLPLVMSRESNGLVPKFFQTPYLQKSTSTRHSHGLRCGTTCPSSSFPACRVFRHCIQVSSQNPFCAILVIRASFLSCFVTHSRPWLFEPPISKSLMFLL